MAVVWNCCGSRLCGIGMWGGNLNCHVLFPCLLPQQVLYMQGPCTRRCTGWSRGIARKEGGEGRREGGKEGDQLLLEVLCNDGVWSVVGFRFSSRGGRGQTN